MHRITKVSIAILIFISFSFTDKKEETFSIVVKVNGLRNNIGNVRFALYNTSNSLPDKKLKKHFKMKVGKIAENAATITFSNLPKGKYAINILHDEDTNGKIAKGWLLPTEGIGFSNMAKIGLGNKPNFAKTSFNLDKNKTIDINVIYL